MIITDLENNLIEDQFIFAQKLMLTPANLGIFKKGSKESFIKTLDEVNTNQLIFLHTRKDYDVWFEKVVDRFHEDLFQLYRANLIVKSDNPYSYSARLLNQFLRILWTRTFLFGNFGTKFIELQHPVFSNTYLKTFSQLGISKINQIGNRDKYYHLVEVYRGLIDKDLCEENEPLVQLIVGEDF